MKCSSHYCLDKLWFHSKGTTVCWLKQSKSQPTPGMTGVHPKKRTKTAKGFVPHLIPNMNNPAAHHGVPVISGRPLEMLSQLGGLEHPLFSIYAPQTNATSERSWTMAPVDSRDAWQSWRFCELGNPWPIFVGKYTHFRSKGQRTPGQNTGKEAGTRQKAGFFGGTLPSCWCFLPGPNLEVPLTLMAPNDSVVSLYAFLESDANPTVLAKWR